jgi:hypothetical protein
MLEEADETWGRRVGSSQEEARCEPWGNNAEWGWSSDKASADWEYVPVPDRTNTSTYETDNDLHFPICANTIHHLF